MTAYLHDSAMAMLQWEYKVLKAVEGTDEIYDNTLDFAIKNDFKPVHSLVDASCIIKENKKYLYNSFSDVSEYVFSYSNENEMINSLATIMIDYENYRNGYIDILQTKFESVHNYMKYSEEIRINYIRERHHKKAAQNIACLEKRIKSVIGNGAAKQFIEALSNVCMSHGEDLAFVQKLDNDKIDWLGEKCNIQFVAMMIRLGDIIHFDSQRAPMSLFAEKTIDNPISRLHWKAKSQELEYMFMNNSQVQIVISFSAFCTSPELYYFVHDYIDWIDYEIENYYTLLRNWKLSGSSNDRYELKLAEKVDRDNIRYDDRIFIPNRELRFVLNQSKILELLMGVQLYKDPLLCLREVYQNSLDSTKCMIAYNNSNHLSEELSITFGLGVEEVNGVTRKYILP